MKRLILICFIFTFSNVNAVTFNVLGWHTQAAQGQGSKAIMNRLKQIKGIDLWGLSHVSNSESANYFQSLKNSSSGDYRYFLGRSGGDQRLMIAYKASRLELLETRELLFMRFSDFNLRGGLFARFKHIQTGTQFYFVVNHFSDSEEIRRQQAKAMNNWMKSTRLPVITLGHYGLQWQLSGSQQVANDDDIQMLDLYETEINTSVSVDNFKPDENIAMSLLTEDRLLRWLQPKQNMATDCKAKQVQDFVFITPGADDWWPEAKVVSEPSICKAARFKPVKATFTFVR